MRTLFLPELRRGFSQEWVLMWHMSQPFAILQSNLKQDKSRTGEHLSEQMPRRREKGLRNEKKGFWRKRSREEHWKRHSRMLSWLLVYLVKVLEKWGDSRHITWRNRFNLLRKKINDFLSGYTFSKTCEISIFYQGKNLHLGHRKSTNPLNSANKPAKWGEKASIAHCKIDTARTADVFQSLWKPRPVLLRRLRKWRVP